MRRDIKFMINDIKGSVRILSFLKNDIKVFSAIYGDNWQSLNILTTGETFAQNIIVYITFECKVVDCSNFFWWSVYIMS